MEILLIVIQLLVSVALVIVVLLQKSEGGALGVGGSSGMGGLFTPRGAADTLTRATTILAVLFFLSSLGLTLVALHSRPQSSSLLDSGANAPTSTAPAPKQAPQPGNPLAPKVPTPQ